MKPRREFSPSVEHRRQMTWQVWVPLGASILIFLGLTGLVVAGALAKSDQIERWGSLSAVWIILPVLFVGLIILTILIACVFGMSKLLVKMPDWMLKVLMELYRLARLPGVLQIFLLVR